MGMGRRWLASPVISVGSCSAGGAGKTPMVLLLTRLLTKRGYSVRILSRGYRRQAESSAVQRVNPAGEAAWFGDEPLLLARRSGAAVFVGADRYAAGLLAEKVQDSERIAVHVLDDGFQHWGLGRDVDVVLLTEEDMKDALLPAGNLRESLGALRDADVIVLREEEVKATAGLVTKLRRGVRAPLIWVIRRRLWFADDVESAEKTAERAELTGRPLAFCGIARPDGFVKMLREAGVQAAGGEFFGDHHEYVDRDIGRLVDAARSCGADGFVTTEKDAVKLTAAMRSALERVGPVAVARLELELLGEKEAMDGMICEGEDD